MPVNFVNKVFNHVKSFFFISWKTVNLDIWGIGRTAKIYCMLCEKVCCSCACACVRAANTVLTSFMFILSVYIQSHSIFSLLFCFQNVYIIISNYCWDCPKEVVSSMIWLRWFRVMIHSNCACHYVEWG